MSLTIKLRSTTKESIVRRLWVSTWTSIIRSAPNSIIVVATSFCLKSSSPNHCGLNLSILPNVLRQVTRRNVHQRPICDRRTCAWKSRIVASHSDWKQRQHWDECDYYAGNDL